MFFDAFKNIVRLVFTYWIHKLWGCAIVLAMFYFFYSFVAEVIKAS